MSLVTAVISSCRTLCLNSLPHDVQQKPVVLSFFLLFSVLHVYLRFVSLNRIFTLSSVFQYRVLCNACKCLFCICLNRTLDNEGYELACRHHQGVLCFQNVIQCHGRSVNVTLLMPVRNVRPSLRRLARTSRCLGHRTCRYLVLNFIQIANKCGQYGHTCISAPVCCFFFHCSHFRETHDNYTEWAKSNTLILYYILYTYFWPTLYKCF